MSNDGLSTDEKVNLLFKNFMNFTSTLDSKQFYEETALANNTNIFSDSILTTLPPTSPSYSTVSDVSTLSTLLETGISDISINSTWYNDKIKDSSNNSVGSFQKDASNVILRMERIKLDYVDNGGAAFVCNDNNGTNILQNIIPSNYASSGYSISLEYEKSNGVLKPIGWLATRSQLAGNAFVGSSVNFGGALFDAKNGIITFYDVNDTPSSIFSNTKFYFTATKYVGPKGAAASSSSGGSVNLDASTGIIISNNEISIDSDATIFTNLDSSVNTLETTTASNTSDISTINSTVTDLSTNVYDMSSNFVDRARAAFSASTGVTIAEGAISIPQEIETTSSVQFGGITVNGDAYATDISTGSLIVDDLTLDNNTITTPSNTHLLLQPGGDNANDTSDRVWIKGGLWVDGSINFSGDMIQTNTNVQVTDQLDISNTGTGPALIARQYGAQPVAQFYDDANLAMEIMNGGDVSMGYDLTVGNMQVRQNGTDYYLGHSNNTDSNYTTRYAIKQESHGATYINTSGTNLRFRQNDSNIMVMTASGLALNGSNGPTTDYKLDVAGDVLFQNDLDVSSIDVSNNINLNNNSSAITLWGDKELYSISMRNTTANGGGSFPYGIQGFATKFSMPGNMGWVFTTAGSGDVSNNNTAMSIRGDGLTHIKGPLGIGVDPSASAWNDYSLSVSQGMRVGYPGGTSSTASGMGFIKITGESAGGSAGLFFGIHNNEDSAHKGAIIFDSGQGVTGGGNGRGDMHFCTTNGGSNDDVTPSSNAQMTIRRTGNIGIHTTDPSYKLHVAGTAYATDISAGNSIKVGATSITDDILTTDISANSLAIGGDYTKFTVDTNGVTSIASTLTVTGHTNLNGLLNLGPIGDEGGEIRFDNGSGNVKWFMDVDIDERMRIRHHTSGQSYGIYILNTGDVGIGTQSPNVKLEIISTDAIRIPKGTTEQRPTGLDGMIRYNTETGGYEGWSGGSANGEWGSLGGTSSVATTSADGLMSSTDKSKLDGIATNANNYSLPTASSDALGGVIVGNNLSISDGVLSATDTDTTYNNATTSAAGLMSSTDKSKLDNIAIQANKYSLPTASSDALGGVKVGNNLSISDGVLSATDTDTTYNNATTSADGLMSSTDKSKLDGIAVNANNYSLPTASSDALGGVIVGNNLSISDGVLSATDTDTTYNNATTSADGLMSSDDKSKLDGIATNANNYSLPTASSDALGGVIVGNNLSISDGVLSATDTDTTYNNATTSAAGLMSSTDKSKLDNIAIQANKYSLPEASSDTLGGVKVGSNISIASGVISIPQAIDTDSSPSFNSLTLSGNLTVNGTTTTLETENLDVSDSLIGLSSGLTSTTSPANDAGILINRGSSDNVFMGWDESAGNFTMGTTLATSSSTGNLSITKGTLVADLEGDVTGNLTGNATTVTNGVYTTGNQNIGGTKTFTSTMTHIGSIPTANQTSTNNAVIHPRMFVGYSGNAQSGILMGSINGNAPYISSTIRGDGSNTTSKLRIYNAKTIAIETLNGDVGIGKEGPAYKLDVNGTAYASDISAGNSIKVGQSIITTNTIPNIDSSINTMESKLNGIESGADVTDATNVLAAGAVMTSGEQSISGSKTFSVLNVTGDVSFNSDLAVAGEISANTLGIGSDYTKFTVDSDGNVNIKGTLTIEGTGSSGNVASLDINDNIISIANGSSEEGYDAGLYITRTGTDQFFGYDNDASKFILGGVSSGSSSSNSISVNTGTLVANIEGNLIDGTTATTQSSGDNTTKVATTAFVNNAVSSSSYSGGNGISLSGTTISLSTQTDTSFSKIDTSFSDIYNWTTDDIAEGSTNKYATESSILTLIGQGVDTTNDVEFKSLTITDSNSGNDVNALSLYNTAGTSNNSSVSVKFYNHPIVETGSISNYRYDGSDYGLIFKNYSTGGVSEHMVLRKGSVGIGTNDPGYKLEVNGSAAATSLAIGTNKTEFSVVSTGETTINANLIVPSSTVIIGKNSTTSSGDYGDISGSDYDNIALDVSGSVRYDVSNTRVYFLNKWGSHQYGTSVYWNMNFQNTNAVSGESLEQSNLATSSEPEKEFGHKDYSWSNNDYDTNGEWLDQVEFDENTVMSIMDPINHNISTYRYTSHFDGGGSDSGNGTNTNASIGLFCENAILCASKIFIFSDRRIKKNIIQINDDQALQDLRKLNPCVYNYIDVAKRGVSKVYGFIAQEVEEVIPYACSKKNEFIPNVYNLADISGNLLILRNGTFNDLSLNITNTITQYKSAILSLSNEKESLNRYVKQIVNDTTIELFEPITTDEALYDASLNKYGIFIYGQYVNDLTTLDKNAIWTVAAAATQEIDRQQQADKVRIAELETKVETLESQLTSVLARLTALENA